MNSQAVTAPIISISSQDSAVAPLGKSPQTSFWAKHKVTILTGVAIFGILAITAVALATFPPAAIIPYLVAVGMPSGILSPIIVAGILGGLSAFAAGISGGLIDYKYQQYKRYPQHKTLEAQEKARLAMADARLRDLNTVELSTPLGLERSELQLCLSPHFTNVAGPLDNEQLKLARKMTRLEYKTAPHQFDFDIELRKSTLELYIAQEAARGWSFLIDDVPQSGQVEFTTNLRTKMCASGFSDKICDQVLQSCGQTSISRPNIVHNEVLERALFPLGKPENFDVQLYPIFKVQSSLLFNNITITDEHVIIDSSPFISRVTVDHLDPVEEPDELIEELQTISYVSRIRLLFDRDGNCFEQIVHTTVPRVDR